MLWSGKSIAALVAAAALSIMSIDANAMPAPRSSHVTIKGDRGGQVIKYALKMLKLRDAGKRVRFAGRCDSACTLYLALPGRQVCVTRGASFGFHQPYGASARGNQIAANYLMGSYPGWVKAWIRNNGGLNGRIKTMSYAYASQYLPTCQDSASRTFKARILDKTLRVR